MTERNLTSVARNLRSNMTEAEKLLWSHLRNRRLNGAKVRRQVPIGHYIADFLCADANLIVEADGGQHFDEMDAERTAFLEAQDYRVIRFWNHDILVNTEGVLLQIAEALDH